MGSYSHKLVANLLPERITEAIEGYEGTVDYNGDQWVAAANYIKELEADLRASRAELERDQQARLDAIADRDRMARALEATRAAHSATEARVAELEEIRHSLESANRVQVDAFNAAAYTRNGVEHRGLGLALLASRLDARVAELEAALRDADGSITLTVVALEGK